MQFTFILSTIYSIHSAETQEQGDKTEDEEEAESYEEMAARLNCDNPWFWNAFQCTWIDVKRKHITSRSKRNATICAWIIGSVLTLVVLWLCKRFFKIIFFKKKKSVYFPVQNILTLLIFICCFQGVLYCSYIGKARRRLKFLKLRKKFTPGQLELPSGKVVKYEPTEEEVQAYEELVKAIIIQEMALMI